VLVLVLVCCSDAMSKMTELANKSNTLTKDLAVGGTLANVGGCQGFTRAWAFVVGRRQGTFVQGVAMDGKVKVTFSGTQVPVETEISEEAMAAGAAKLSAALTEAMKDGHAKSLQIQSQRLGWVGSLDIAVGCLASSLRQGSGVQQPDFPARGVVRCTGSSTRRSASARPSRASSRSKVPIGFFLVLGHGSGPEACSVGLSWKRSVGSIPSLPLPARSLCLRRSQGSVCTRPDYMHGTRQDQVAAFADDQTSGRRATAGADE
jgi:hypothetical protein